MGGRVAPRSRDGCGGEGPCEARGRCSARQWDVQDVARVGLARCRTRAHRRKLDERREAHRNGRGDARQGVHHRGAAARPAVDGARAALVVLPASLVVDLAIAALTALTRATPVAALGSFRLAVRDVVACSLVVERTRRREGHAHAPAEGQEHQGDEQANPNQSARRGSSPPASATPAQVASTSSKHGVHDSPGPSPARAPRKEATFRFIARRIHPRKMSRRSPPRFVPCAA